LLRKAIEKIRGVRTVIKRTVEVSAEPAHLTARLDQLLIQRDGKTIGSIPCEDIVMLVVDQPQTTYSQAALAGLARSDAVLVVCGADHLPAALLLPLADHHEVVWRVAEQAAVGRALQKRLWKQLVRAKIRGQALNLAPDCPAHQKLLELAKKVRSGDPANVEAHAAQVYWRHWLDPLPFRRDKDGDGINAMLNYGYAIVRAAVARALVAAGLLPALGLFHANRSNAFCLADDLMEPLRPLVDRRVRALHRQGHEQLNPAVKRGLLELLAERVRMPSCRPGDCPDFCGAADADSPTDSAAAKMGPSPSGRKKDRFSRGPLMVNLHRMTASLMRCYQGEADRLEIPLPCTLADTDVCGS
jgi:CRISP-associated protein Cas1